MNRLAKWIMRLYPARWRARYGDEVDALLADSGADARVVADLFQGGIRMRVSTWSFLKLAPVLAIVGMLIGFGTSFLVKPVYMSRATMQMTPAVIVASDAQRNFVPDLDKIIKRMETVVLSDESVDSIINDPRLQLYSDERATKPHEDVIGEMKQNIRIQFVGLPGQLTKRAVAFDISFTYPDRFKSQQTVQALMNRFDEQNQAMQVRPSGEHLSPVGEVLDVIDIASLPVRPVAPNRLTIAAAGFFVGLLAAVVIAIVGRMKHAHTMSVLTPSV
jgi:capsular polysaccharide biosynthesis protein